MVRILPVLVVLFLGHAVADDLSACSAGCISSVFSDSTSFGCAQNDKLCVCNAGSNFQYAVRDCITQACSLTGDALNAQLTAAQTSAQSQCAAVQASASGTTTVASAATTTDTPATTAQAATTTSPSPSPSATTTASLTTTSAEGSTTTGVTNSAAPTTLQTSTTASSSSTTIKGNAASSSSAPVSSSSAQVTGSSSNSTSASTSDSSSSDSDSSSGGLSVGAKAGIGAGAGIAVLLSGIVFCFVHAKKRKSQPGSSRIPTMQISKPMPGSGRQYAGDLETAAKDPYLSTQFRDAHPAEYSPARYSPSAASSQYSPRFPFAPSRPSRDSDRSLQTRRYEDMVPRVQPRTMI